MERTIALTIYKRDEDIINCGIQYYNISKRSRSGNRSFRTQSSATVLNIIYYMVLMCVMIVERVTDDFYSDDQSDFTYFT